MDCLVIGPTGVFAIETKTYSLFENGVAGIDAGGLLQLGGKSAINDPLKQARGCAALVYDEIRRYTSRETWVDPVVVLPGWRIESPKADAKVVLVNEDTLSEYLKTRPEKLTTRDINDICSHLDRSARS